MAHGGLISRSEVAERHRLKRLRLGLCSKCSRPLSQNNKSYCEYHRQRQLQEHKDRRDYRKLHGLCVKCANPVLNNTHLCEYHRLKYNEYQKEYKKRLSQ